MKRSDDGGCGGRRSGDGRNGDGGGGGDADGGHGWIGLLLEMKVA